MGPMGYLVRAPTLTALGLALGRLADCTVKKGSSLELIFGKAVWGYPIFCDLTTVFLEGSFPAQLGVRIFSSPSS